MKLGGVYHDGFYVQNVVTFLFLLHCWILPLTLGNVVPEFVQFYFTLEPSDIIAHKGSRLTLDCTVHYSENSRPLLFWMKDGILLDPERNDRYSIARNGSLHISDVADKRSASDAGSYQCGARVDGYRILSKRASIRVAGIERNFATQPQDLEVYLTNTAMFQCGIGSVPDANITWFKDNSLVQDRPGKYRSYPEGVLEIYNVEFRDFGTYHCQAAVHGKSRTSRNARLTQKKAVFEEGVQGVAPMFTLRPRDTVARVKSKVVLFCGASGLGSDMTSPNITWLKDESSIDLNKDGRVTMIGGGNLQILNVKAKVSDDSESDDAKYMCRAGNDVDSVDAEAKLTVIVPPIFINHPQSVNLKEKNDVTLECRAKGQPKPTITWYKNGNQIQEEDYFEMVDKKNGKDLRILGLITNDSGIYQCFAENIAGSIQATLQLQVHQQDMLLPHSASTPSIFYHVHRSGALQPNNPNEVPSQPKNLKSAITSYRFVTLSWGLPDRTGPLRSGPSEITHYLIEWQELGSQRQRITNTTAQEVNIQRLKPNTEYEFRVTAFNKYGRSIKPAVLKLKTQEEDDVPSEPKNVRVAALSPTSLKITWEKPTMMKGKILHYEIMYYPNGAEVEAKETVSGTSTSFILRDLQEFQEYTFRLVAHNANGPGVSTGEIIGYTLSDVPSDVPLNFTLETTSSTSMVVRWQPPPLEHQNGKITGYKIRYKKKGAKKGLTVTTAGDRDVYALTDLKKDTSYQVRITAQTVNGSGPPTDWLFAKTYEDDLDETKVPDMPDKLVVRPTTNSLVVQWLPNRRSKILVRGYYLGYGKGIPDVYRQLFDANTFFYTIENLQPASEYVVSILAFNNVGEGQPRYETVFTKEDTAEEPVTPMLPPIGLKAIVLSANTIVLTWTDDSLGKIQRITDNRYYTVRYQSQPPTRNRFKYVNSTDLNCHIDDLRPDTVYTFSVKVTKGRRKSTWSMSVANKTQEAAPGSMPRDLTPVPVEGDRLSVTLNWQPPAKPNGQVTGYLVFYTTDPSKDDLEWVVEGVIGEKLSMTITDLTEDTTYYFKVQARNSKGYGPMSTTVIYKTPENALERPRKIPNDRGPGGHSDNKQPREETGGLSQNVMIIIIACVVGATFCIVVAVVTVFLCRRRDIAERNRRMASMYKGSPLKAKSPKPEGPPKGEGRPPDLWIDHDHLELKHLGKDDPAESTISVPSTRRNSHDSSSIHTVNPDLFRESGSEAEERLLPPSYHQLTNPNQQRNIIRPKPLKLPVDSITHAREPVATVSGYPNGNLMQRYVPSNRPPSPVEDSGVVPMRPVYPRTQYQMQYSTQGPPRVNAGDISNTSLHGGYPMDFGYRLVPCREEDERCLAESMDDSYIHKVGYGGFTTPSHHGSLTRRCKINQRAPITGIASPVVPVHPTEHVPDPGSGSLGRSGNSLKSFRNLESPSRVPRNLPGSHSTPKHIVKPQQTATPYKKPSAPISSGPIKPRPMMQPMVSPKSAPDVLKTGSEDPDIQKSLSTEELTAEMANLEGLMKDLNAITQQDFECSH